MTLHSDIAKAAISASVSVASFIAQSIEQVPAWIREFGLPLVMLAGAIIALVYLYKELRAERLARIADRDAFIAKMEDRDERNDAYRESMLRATIDQTNEIRGMRREMEKK